MATIARSSELQSVTWIGRPSRVVPCPRSAAKHSPLTGLNTTPAASPSSSSSAMLTPHALSPYRKFTVPSRGSTIQRRPLSPLVREPSSATRASSGRSVSSSSRITRSASRSASETGSVAEVLDARPSGARP